MRWRSKAIITPVLMVSILYASGARSQSVFGLNYLGEHCIRGDSRSRALGYSALAVPDTSSVFTMNPATLAELGGISFSISEIMDMSSIKYGDVIADQNRFQMPSVMLAVPVGYGLVIGSGYITRFKGRNDFAFNGESLPDYPTPQEIYKHRSSIFSVPLTASWKRWKWFSIAGELQLERGSITDEVNITFNDDSFDDAVSTRKRNFTGTSWAASVLANPFSRLYLGGFFDDRIDYSVEEYFEYSRDHLDSASTWDFELPSAYGLGVAIGLTERWWLSSTYWSRRAPDRTGFEQLENSIGDERLIAFGIERRGGIDGGFFSRIPIRLGFYENVWHLEYPSGKPVRSLFATLGTGFSMPSGPGSLDISVELGRIGSLDENGIEETVLRLGLSMNMSERWTRRRREEH